MIIQAMQHPVSSSPDPSGGNAGATAGVADPAGWLDGLAALDSFGVIRAAGPDSTSFLQGQLTQDFALLGADQARLAAYCSAQGRMQASFIGFRGDADEMLLLCSRDLLAATLKRLSMFVLRAKVRLSDASAEFRICGLTGAALASVAGPARPAWSRLEIDGASVVFLYPACGVARALWIAPAALPLPAAATLDPELWRWSEVRAGVATVTAPTALAYVPQMLNYESVGGVNFKKGCSPGQEVVARSQFRGTLKRRAYIVHAGAALGAGDELFPADDPSQPCGTVVQAAAAPGGGFDAIASLQVAAAQAGGLRLADGSAFELLALPYPLLDDI